ncbi:hypothetical protein BC832DRAFT_529756 [Gaertneriomyces semiglobifer]|nr:hypothetical protein BC832DRAFT_529756 [Gaertneriomyces semiglobifer]
MDLDGSRQPSPSRNGVIAHAANPIEESPQSLHTILDRPVDDEHLQDALHPNAEDISSDSEAEGPTPEGFCVECEDQPVRILCQTCDDAFCEVCFRSLHRKGKRKRHATKLLGAEPKKRRGVLGLKIGSSSHDNHDKVVPAEQVPVTEEEVKLPSTGEKPGDYFVKRAEYIPLRLTLKERKLLRLLEAALSVSEYTDKIDILTYGSKQKRIVAQIRELCSILSGLVLAADYKTGQDLFKDRDFEANEAFFQEVFEIGRRYKICNPEKMRDTYGKLCYMLMDSQLPEVKSMLGFDCVVPIKTVYTTLEQHEGGLNILHDELITWATMEILPAEKSRQQIQKEIKMKERAIEAIARKYATKTLDAELIKQCLYSIGDNHAFLRSNRDPCLTLLDFLKSNFPPADTADESRSLAIRSGKDGARLSHNHSRQYTYVLQSLTLWSEILYDMFELWMLAERDMFEGTYRLRDTGQGLQRVQGARRVGRAMQGILSRCMQKCGGWVGSSVVHLGDHNVPNALVFIDKYTQVHRILLPICTTLSKLPSLSAEPNVAIYFCSFLSKKAVPPSSMSTALVTEAVNNIRMEILQDFFKHGFDGSGADNFFDAGSCIDGRLTSAWNWCSQVEKKRWWGVFLVSGFRGFDGEW